MSTAWFRFSEELTRFLHPAHRGQRFAYACARGHYVRALKPQAQLREVAERYRLAERAQPFTRCLHCNLALAAVEKSAIAHRLPKNVAEAHHAFTHCAGCDRIYWPGSHYARMCAALGRITQIAMADSTQQPSAAAKPGA